MNFLSLGFGTATIGALIAAIAVEGQFMTVLFFSVAVVLACCTAILSRLE